MSLLILVKFIVLPFDGVKTRCGIDDVGRPVSGGFGSGRFGLQTIIFSGVGGGPCRSKVTSDRDTVTRGFSKGDSTKMNQVALEVEDCSMVSESIPCMVNEEMNKMLTILPSLVEIKVTVFALNIDSAPGPDGFGVSFYQTYWEIIQHDVAAAVIQFFSNGWLPHGFNVNVLVLIPKLVSQEQKGFIQGRQIKDCIALASEAFNLLDSKSWCGNVALKVDILKAFDTLNWNFLLQVLIRFGFNAKFYLGQWRAPWWPNPIQVPSRLFYADDVLIFCKGSVANIKSMIKVFKAYEGTSGQSVNCSKSSIFGGAMSQSRLNILSVMYGFSIGNSSLIYPRVPIYKGKPRAKYLLPNTDKIILKFALWKGALLSFAGRVALVKSLIQSMLIHSMSIYDWPVLLLSAIQRATRGLGIRSLFDLNAASNLELAWDFINSDNPWAVLVRGRVLRKNFFIKHHIFSSCWSGTKAELLVSQDNSSWKLGNGKSIRFWFDSWYGNLLHLDGVCILHCHIPFNLRPDKRIWKGSVSGELTLKEDYEFKRACGVRADWWRWIWSKYIPPSKSFLVWRLLLRKLASDDQLKKRNFLFPSMCSLCFKAEETISDLFFYCDYAWKLWDWLANALKFSNGIFSWEDISRLRNRTWSKQCHLIFKVFVIFLLNCIWFTRNSRRFKDVGIPISASVAGIVSACGITGNNSKTPSFVNISDFEILKNFKIIIQPPSAPRIVEVIWKSAPWDWIKINCDGAFSENPRPSACGGITRDFGGRFFGAFVSFLGVSNSLIAELTGAMMAVEFTHEKGWRRIWLEVDSVAVVRAFSPAFKVPWQARNRWVNCVNITDNMDFVASHICREGNSCAESLDNVGLTVTEYTNYNCIPNFLRADFVKNKLDLSFFKFISS
ncbi:uncharacterized protein LOC131596826 [Vicia villosa]|uniref:uncharacterized protein LOC131596826 n=1 Tax=Vicia villosa TaxID=3911 RepID=UPI00273ADD84|nr:uncharacterized protein LOC131596826 [Vicia villosa]